MELTENLSHELVILSLFNQHSFQEGLKVHAQRACEDDVEATKRLFKKGLITQEDGGYLTSLGKDAVEKLQDVILMLNKKS